jgi:hypothetical protein
MSDIKIEETRVRHAARKSAVTEALAKAEIPGDAPHGYVVLELAIEWLYAAGAVASVAQREALGKFVGAALQHLDNQRGH